MKFIVSSEILSKQLQKAHGAVAANPVLDILTYYKFQVKNNILEITATDMETTVITSVQVESDGDFIFTIPAGKITDTIRSLPSMPVEFTYSEEEETILVKAGKAEYTMLSLTMEDFPELPSRDETNQVKINSNVLINAFNKASFATSNDEVRQAMQGVFIEIDFDKATFVATDAHKLVKYTYSGLQTDIAESFIIPKKSAGLIKNVFDNDTEITMAFSRKNVHFISADRTMISRLIDANFPDYNIVIPSDNPNHVIIDRNSLLNTLKRIIIFSNQTTNGVTFQLKDDTMTLSAQDVDFSIKAEDTLPCQYDGEETKIGFSGKFLVEILNHLESDEVRIKLSTPNRPSLIVPEEQEKENTDVLMVLMPLVVQRI